MSSGWRRWIVAAALVAAIGPAALAGQGTGGVEGTVTVTGGRTNADVVVSLAKEGLALAPPPTPVEIDQKGLKFTPHVLAVVRGTTIRFLNNDIEDHNVYSPEGAYNLGTWPPGQTRDQVFDRTGVYTQLCRIHPDMEAFIVVLDTPYFAVTDARGQYTIGHVPPGTYTLATWGKRLSKVERPVTVAAGPAARVDLTLSR